MSKLLIVEARFYEDVSDALVSGATRVLQDQDCTFDRVAVPGAFEIPGAIAMAAKLSKAYDGYLALGCVIKGETSHYDIVAGDSARGLMDLAVRKRLAIGNGILTVDTMDQAMARADPSRKNKGGGAAQAVLTMMSLRARWGLS